MKKFLIAKNIFFDLRIGWAQKLWAGYYPLNLEGFVSKSLLCLRCFCSSTVVLMGHGDICRQQASSREEAPSEGSRQDLNRIWIQQLLVLVRSEFNKSRFDKKFPTKNVKQMHENGGVSVFFLLNFSFFLLRPALSLNTKQK